MQGEPVNLVAQALWVEGLAMGLLIAEARAAAESSGGGGYPSEAP